jgi:hypothetical protein
MVLTRPRGRVFGGESARRWECQCREPAVLLGTVEPNGRINIKSRDRYWHIEGIVRTTCPRCGMEHVLDPKTEQELPEQTPPVSLLPPQSRESLAS